MGKHRVMGGVPRARSELGRSRGDRRRMTSRSPAPSTRPGRAARAVHRGRIARAAHAADLDRLLQRADPGRGRRAVRGWRPVPRDHRAERRPAVHPGQRPADAEQDRVGRAAAGAERLLDLGLAAEAVRKPRRSPPSRASRSTWTRAKARRAPADPRRLLQVLDNLISNAVKFSNSGGLVRVATRCARSTWRIDVSDTGIGIPPGEAENLFGAFARGSNARIAGLPGTGLGLSIVKVLVEMHGGDVRVDSVLDEGTKFSVFLRCTRRRGRDDRPDAASSRTTRTSRSASRPCSTGAGSRWPGPTRAGGAARLPRPPAQPRGPRHRAAGDGRLDGARAHPRPERRARPHAHRARPGGREGARAAQRGRRLPDQAVRQRRVRRPGAGAAATPARPPSRPRPRSTTTAACG